MEVKNEEMYGILQKNENMYNTWHRSRPTFCKNTYLFKGNSMYKIIYS